MNLDFSNLISGRHKKAALDFFNLQFPDCVNLWNLSKKYSIIKTHSCLYKILLVRDSKLFILFFALQVFHTSNVICLLKSRMLIS